MTGSDPSAFNSSGVVGDDRTIGAMGRVAAHAPVGDALWTDRRADRGPDEARPRPPLWPAPDAHDDTDGSEEAPTAGAEAWDLRPLVEALGEGAAQAKRIGETRLAHRLRDLLVQARPSLLLHVDRARCGSGASQREAYAAEGLLRWQHAALLGGLARLEIQLFDLGRTDPSHRQLDDLSARLFGLAALLNSHVEQERALAFHSDEGPEWASRPYPGRCEERRRDLAAGPAREPHRPAVTVRRQHRGLQNVLWRLESLATLTPALADPGLASALRGLLDAAATTLIPHFAWEERSLFPALDDMIGAAGLSRLLRLQHAEVRDGVERVDADWLLLCRGERRLDRDDPSGRLHSLRALLEAHLQQEEAVLLPILLSGDEPARGQVPISSRR